MSSSRTIQVAIRITGDIGVSDRSVIDAINAVLQMPKHQLEDRLRGYEKRHEIIEAVIEMLPSYGRYRIEPIQLSEPPRIGDDAGKPRTTASEVPLDKSNPTVQALFELFDDGPNSRVRRMDAAIRKAAHTPPRSAKKTKKTRRR